MKVNYRDFIESCGLSDEQVDMACKMMDTLEGRNMDGCGMAQILMCMQAFFVEVIRRRIQHTEQSDEQYSRVRLI